MSTARIVIVTVDDAMQGNNFVKRRGRLGRFLSDSFKKE